MSRPENPLAKFRTYSYQFVLALATDLSTAKAWGDNPKDIPQTGRLSDRRKVTNGVAVLINTVSDSDYIISEFSCINVLTPQGGSVNGPGADTHGMTNTDATMKVREPRGVDFLNDLRILHSIMGKDPNATVFALRIRFMGHNDAVSDPTMQESVEAEAITIYLKLMMIEGTFEVDGATYDLQFVGISNGVTRMPQTVKIADEASIASSKKLTLQAAFDTLQKQVNDREKLRYENEKNSGGTVGGKIAYVFDAGPDYEKCIINQHLPSMTSGGNPKNERGSFNFGKSPNVDKMMIDMAWFCHEIQKDPKNTDEVFFVPNVNSVELTGDLAKEFAAKKGIQGDVDQLLYYKLFKHAQPMTSNCLEDQENRVAPAGDAIEFDYWFTGKNIDILELELKLTMGLAFITTSSLGSVVGGGSGSRIVDEPITARQSRTKVSMDKATADGTFLSGSSSPPAIDVRNKQAPEDMHRARAAMAKAAGLEMIQANMVITGNPSLLANLNQDPVALIKGQPRDARNPASNVNPSWPTVKGYCKVNIQYQDVGEDGGRHVVDGPGGSGPPIKPGDAQFAKSDFWYNGFYQILMVESKFDGGMFTQDLSIMSLPFCMEGQGDDTAERTPAGNVRAESLVAGGKPGDKAENVDPPPARPTATEPC